MRKVCSGFDYQHYSVSDSLIIDLTFASLNEVSEIVDTLNCNPHSLPNATEEPLNCSVEMFSFFAFSKIFVANFFGAD
jgi:hypothetical protein